ncbi:glycosyltransferase family 4 protein [Microbacterium laevaniformans]|uniref:glycosyltransferase family 4 protein n=1 Tax=Microbacterium laevaniformans TaxID=36807 RepID=UPI00195EA37A|nr:glycosyltransferase family 4 protein [Microbacterium laevaniformans]MBM7751800.1 glycosyltransferase involved in cell wall biosynthesis [Microbacterium laevaniformans]GLJ63845.1 glycosyl transferase family 1 [Microbacterium laevaniformans]
MTVGRMAIAYDCLFPFTTGGGERQYRAFAEALADRGVEVEYLTARQWEGSSPEVPGVRVTAVTERLELYDAGGVRRTAAALAFAWGLFRALRRRRHAYDAVMVSALPVLNVFAARAALWVSGTTLVVDYLEVWHRRQWAEYAGRITGAIAWMLQRLAIAVTPVATCHSQLSATRLRAEGLRGDVLISPGLISEQSAAPSVGPPAAPPFALYVGRHIPDKRVELLPDAVAHARASVPELRLVILGDGPSNPVVRDAVSRQVAGSEWVSMPGFVSDDDLDRLLSTAACVVNPSRREGYGLVVVEAAAHGTPVVLVADEGNAATELIDEGVNGYVAVDAGASALGDTIVRAVTSGPRLRETTRGWYRDAISTRTVARTIDIILHHLENQRADTSSARRRKRTP